jgi:hypothetical protein
MAVPFAAGCVPASPGTSIPAVRVYVANGSDETIAALDGERGTLAGVVLPAGTAARQIVSGPNGSLLAISAEGRPVDVRHIEPAGESWVTSSVPLEVGTTDAVIASDGLNRAAIAYHVPRTLPNGSSFPNTTPLPRLTPPRGTIVGPAGASSLVRPFICRLALIDSRHGTVDNTLTACAVGETVTGLALNADPGAPVVYLAIRDDTPRRFFTSPEGRHRVVAMDGTNGAITATRVLDGAPSHLIAAPMARGRPRWIYALQEPPRSAASSGFGVVPSIVATERLLLRLHPDTLDIDRSVPIGAPVDAMDAADDSALYLLQGDTVSRVAVSSGKVQVVTRLPEPGHDLAVTPHWIFVTHPEGGEVWAIDRRSGHLVRRIATGTEPLGISTVLS